MGIPKQPKLTDVEYQINKWAHINSLRELHKAEQRIVELEGLTKLVAQINIYDIKDKYVGLSGVYLLSRNHLLATVKEIVDWRRSNVRYK